jgi:hypothetical protein
MLPDHPDHKNPELGEIFEAAIPQVAKILVDCDWELHRIFQISEGS